MDNDTKVTLSVGELAMANDKNIILTKQAIIAKAAALFNEQIPTLSILFHQIFKDDKKLISSIPKISKGENYNGFPYVIMDYPASFDKENIFALRTMFLWGNFISITLHLKGKYKEMFAADIFKKIAVQPAFYVSISDDEWLHDFNENNFIKVKDVPNQFTVKVKERNFFKIALKYELHHWNMMQSVLPEGYEKIKKLFIS